MFCCHCSAAKVRAMYIALWLHLPSVSVLNHLPGELIKVNTDLSFTCWQTWAICTHSPMILLIISTWDYHQIVGFILFSIMGFCGYIYTRSSAWKGLTPRTGVIGCESSDLEVGNETWALCKSSTPHNCWSIFPAPQKHTCC